MFKISQAFKVVGNTLKAHSPSILIGTGLVFCFSSVVLAINATPKAISAMEDLKDMYLPEEVSEDEVECPSCGRMVPNNIKDIDDHIADYHSESEELAINDFIVPKIPVREKFRCCWKYYIAPFSAFALGTLCIIFSNRISAKRGLELASAYKMSEYALSEYKNKVKELYGENKAQNVEDEIAKDKLTNTYDSGITNAIYTGRGNTLCLDYYTGQYFYSDINDIHRAVNVINSELLTDSTDGCAGYNRFREEIGETINDHDICRFGEIFGWRTSWGLIELNPTSSIAPDGTPCFVIKFTDKSEPRYGYDLYSDWDDIPDHSYRLRHGW